MTCGLARALGWVLLLWLGAGCTPEVSSQPQCIGDAGLGDASTADGLDPTPRGYVVVSSDYAVTSVSLLSADGSVLKRDFIDSGSASTGLVTALSGDVVVPTRSGERGVLVLLDRFRTDVLTRIDLASGKILGQLKTHAQDADLPGTYSSNPRDYIYLDAHTAWVTRYEPSGVASIGADLMRLDPARFTRSDERVGFSKWDGQAERENPDTGERQTLKVYARPSSMVRLGDRVAVGIDSSSLSFDASGDGMTALVDLRHGTVSMLRLPGLQGCGVIAPVPDDATRVAVSCTGFFRGEQRASAGLAMLVLDGDELVIEHSWHVADHAQAALAVFGLQPIDAQEVLAMAPGDDASEAATHDKLYRVNLATAAQHEVLEAQGRFVLGQSAYDPRSGLLLVPDASTDDAGRPSAGVRRFERRADGTFVAKGILELDAVLPPRQVRAFQ